MSFNLMPLVGNRYILVVSQKDHMIFDTLLEIWVPVQTPAHGEEGALNYMGYGGMV